MLSDMFSNVGVHTIEGSIRTSVAFWIQVHPGSFCDWLWPGAQHYLRVQCCILFGAWCSWSSSISLVVLEWSWVLWWSPRVTEHLRGLGAQLVSAPVLWLGLFSPEHSVTRLPVLDHFLPCQAPQVLWRLVQVVLQWSTQLGACSRP